MAKRKKAAEGEKSAVEEGKPLEFSEEEGERVQRFKVKEDIDIFDEVFEGKKEKHLDEELPAKTKGEGKREAKELKGGLGAEEDEGDEEEEEDMEGEEGVGGEGDYEGDDEEERPDEEGVEGEGKFEGPKRQQRRMKKGRARPKAKDEKGFVKVNKEKTQNEKSIERLNVEELPGREEIKETIISKAAGAAGVSLEAAFGEKMLPLKFLEDEQGENAFIGRMKGLYQKYGMEGGLQIGRVAEEEKKGKNIFLDSLNPHVVFVCGSRGSGKSYVLGVIAEELAMRNKNVGIVVIDPIGVFWSMKFANKEERELEALKEWGLKAQGLKNLKVFIPEGMKAQVPKNTYDATFSMQPSLLTSEDWCLTFGMERFGPSGLLLDKLLKKMEHGYTAEGGRYVKAKKGSYSIADLIECLETDDELKSRDYGFKQDSIRALVSRFDAAMTWGIFGEKGTPLSALSRENQLTVLDTSFLEDNVGALVISLLARRILSARKLSTRKEAAKKFKEVEVEELLELEIPPTWLFIDEAHTLIPSGNVRTPATHSLTEYVKQGRRPGCSLVFATQQPSAIDTRVLSQLDILISHKLVFDDDIKSIFKRIPTIVPHSYKKSVFIRTLPIGSALVGDRREETSRAFVIKVRPRLSQHEGREAETLEKVAHLNGAQVELMVQEMLYKKLEREGFLEHSMVSQVLETLNARHGTKAMLSNVLDALEERGIEITDKGARLPEKAEEIEKEEKALKAAGEIPEREIEGEELREEEREARVAPEKTQLLSFAPRISAEEARALANKLRRKRFLGLIGGSERLKGVQLRHQPVYRVDLDEFNYKNEFVSRQCYVDSASGEFLHFNGKRFVESKGLANIKGLSREEVEVLLHVGKKKSLPEKIKGDWDYSEEKVKKILDRLSEKGFIEKERKEDRYLYNLRERAVDLPPSPRHPLLRSLNVVRLVRVDAALVEEKRVPEKEALESLKLLFPNTIVKRVLEVFRPFYRFEFEGEDGSKRRVEVDAVTGETIREKQG